MVLFYIRLFALQCLMAKNEKSLDASKILSTEIKHPLKWELQTKTQSENSPPPVKNQAHFEKNKS
jgi:hypothetical protein